MPSLSKQSSLEFKDLADVEILTAQRVIMTKATVVYARRVDTRPSPEEPTAAAENGPTEHNRARPKKAKRDPERRLGTLLSAEAVKQLRRLLHRLGDEGRAMQGGFF